MKNFKLARRALSCVLAFVMLFGTITTAFAIEPAGGGMGSGGGMSSGSGSGGGMGSGSGGSMGSGSGSGGGVSVPLPVDPEPVITYVSLGDSMTNGYGLEGYNGNNGVEDYGISYANKFEQWLVTSGRASDVNHYQLAMSGCRAEDYHWFLELDHADPEIRDFLNEKSSGWVWNENEWFEVFKIGDFRTWDDMVEDNDRSSAAASNILGYKDYDSPYATDGQKAAAQCLDDGTSAHPHGNYVHYTNDNQAAIVAEYMQTAIKNADIVSMSIGNSNFGTFMFDQIINATGYQGNTPSKAMRFNIERALEELPDEVKAKVLDLKDELYAIIEEKLGIELDYEVGADIIDGNINPDNMTAAIANAAVYAGVSYVLNFAGTVDAILRLNPDAEIILVGLMNTYLSTNENTEEATIGSLLEVIFPPLNAFIAALPTVMQGIKNDVYKDATFYYAEAPEVACMVEVYGSDFYIGEGEERTCNRASITRQRFFRDLLGTIGDFITSTPLNIGLTFEELCAYDEMNDVEKATYAYNNINDNETTDPEGTNDTNATTCAIYLAFEKATIESGKKAPVTLNSLSGLGNMSLEAFLPVMEKYNSNLADRKPLDEETSLNAIAAIFNAAAESEFHLFSDVTADQLREVYEAADGDKATKAEEIMSYIADHPENEAFVEAQAKQGVYDNISEEDYSDAYSAYATANDLPYTWEQFKQYGGVNYTAFVEGVKAQAWSNYGAGAIATAKNFIVSEGAPIILSSVSTSTVDALCKLLGTPYALGDAMAEDDVAVSWFGLLGRCVIGDGLGGHPSSEGHDSLFEAVKTSYEEKHTAKDETVENIKELIDEYYDDAYRLADEKGYVDDAAKAIDKAINVILGIDLSDVKMTDEFRAKLNAEMGVVVEELVGLKAILENDMAGDVEGLYATASAFGENMKAHLIALGELLEQAKVDVKAVVVPVIDAYIATFIDVLEFEKIKAGHAHYEKDEDSAYVAIGEGTVKGNGLTNQKYNYAKLVAGKYELDEPTVLSAIAGEENSIKAADLITYQQDAMKLVNALMDETPDMNNYLTNEEQEFLNVVLGEIKAVLTTNWSDYANAKIAEVLPVIKENVISKLPQEVPFKAEIFDFIVEIFKPYVKDAINYAESKRAELNITEEVYTYFEKLVYVAIAYAMDTKATIETIQEINPDATLVVVGMYNQFRGLKLEIAGNTIDAGKYFEYAIKATNIYYMALAKLNGNFAFADVSDASITGVNDVISITGTNLSLPEGILNNIYADAAGHATITEQIVKALTCLPALYESVDKYDHAVKCVLCGEVAYKEKHVYGGDKVCDLCGYKKSTTSGLTGGSVVVSSYKVTFETNGGSKVNAVSVKKDALLEKPADPTKEGFTFGGWYTDAALTAKYDFATPVTKSFTLYAKWLSEKTAKFTDLDVNAWYYDYVTTIIEKGLMNGVSETEFAPNANLTRAMFVTVLYRVEGTPAVAEVENKFTDVADGQYYTDAVKWASANGIVNGVTETEFKPEAEVTREQMAAMLARYVEYKKLAVTDAEVAYADDAEISDYAKDAVKVAGSLKILIGNANGTFAPKKNATRAEVATLFVRLLGALEK